MKVLELTNYTSGACGVAARAIQESQELVKLGHKVIIFSSNLTKGSHEIAVSEEKINNITVKRFPHLALKNGITF
ncbi:MAG: hypothetical protein AABY22_15055, partial [Nanoarchaeota archaeon]